MKVYYYNNFYQAGRVGLGDKVHVLQHLDN